MPWNDIRCANSALCSFQVRSHAYVDLHMHLVMLMLICTCTWSCLCLSAHALGHAYASLHSSCLSLPAPYTYVYAPIHVARASRHHHIVRMKKYPPTSVNSIQAPTTSKQTDNNKSNADTTVWLRFVVILGDGLTSSMLLLPAQ